MIKFGIIGCGNVSGTYLYALSENKLSEVVAVVDIDKNKAKKKAEEFNVPSYYSDYNEMLDREDLDAVVICTPHFVHYEQFLTCANRKLDILCEKPFATNMHDITEMINNIKDIKLSVMLQRRFYPNSLYTRHAVDQGLFGEISKVSLKFTCHKTEEFYEGWRGKKISGGGVLLSQALHRIDQLAFFFGEPIAVEGKIQTTRDYIEIEDYSVAKIYFDNGIVADIEADNTSGNSETISIISIEGDNGNIILSDDKVIDWAINSEVPGEVDINNIPVDIRPAYYGPCHEMVIDDFVEALFSDSDPKISVNDAIVSTKIVFGIYESSLNNGKIIYL